MCVVSNIGDGWRDKFPDRWPNVPQCPSPGIPEISRTEFNELKKEMEELKKLLKQAKDFDEKTGQQNCQMKEKVDFIKRMARALGVDITGVFDNKKPKTKKK